MIGPRIISISLIATLISFCIPSAAPTAPLKDAPKKSGSTKDLPQKTVPSTVQECVIRLKKELPKKILDDIKVAPDGDMYKFNSSIGAEIRNNWLWGHSTAPLAKSFFKQGIRQPDHMSSAILRALRADLQSKPMDMKAFLTKVQLAEFRTQDFVTETIEIPKQLSSVSLTTLDGKTTSIEDQRGHVTVLAISNADAGYSLEEMALLNTVFTNYSSKGVRVLALIAQGDTPEKLKDLLSKTKPLFPIVVDLPQGFRRSLTQTFVAPSYLTVPANVVLDKQGNMVYRTSGWVKETAASLTKKLDELTQVNPPD